MPGRDRKACKSKFKAEDKRDPNRITYCLNNRIPYGRRPLLLLDADVVQNAVFIDMETLSRMTGRDFSGPTPEIRAPTRLTLGESAKTNKPESDGASLIVEKQSGPTLGNDGEEIIGDADTFDQGP